MINISYIFFYPSWFDYLNKNKISINYNDNFYQYDIDNNTFFIYLLNSIISSYYNHSDKYTYTIWVVDIDNQKENINLVIDNFLKTLNQLKLKVVINFKIIPYPSIADTISKILDSPSKSFSLLHEFVIYYIIYNTTNEFLAICDADTLFIDNDFITKALETLKNNKLLASFIEKPRIINNLKPGYISLPRIHTFFMIFNNKKLKNLIPIKDMLDNIYDSNFKISLVKNKTIAEYLYNNPFWDTLLFLTCYLTYNHSNSLISDLENNFPTLISDKMNLVLANQYFIHCKYLDNNNYSLLKNIITNNNNILSSYTNILEKIESTYNNK